MPSPAQSLRKVEPVFPAIRITPLPGIEHTTRGLVWHSIIDERCRPLAMQRRLATPSFHHFVKVLDYSPVRPRTGPPLLRFLNQIKNDTTLGQVSEV